MIDWTDIPGNPRVRDELLDLLSRPTAIAVVGAGASVSLGYPTWEGLLKKLIDRLDPGPEQHAAWIAGLSDRPQRVATAICRAFSEGELAEALYDLFGPIAGPDGRRFSSVHASLLQLPFHGYLTTNYDPCLDEARRVLRPDATGGVVTWRDSAVSRWHSDAIFDQHPCPILWGHGHYERPESIILDLDGYRRVYVQDEGRPYRQTFDRLWMQKHLVFVGFGVSDPWLDFLIDQNITQSGRRRAQSPRHVAILGLPEDRLVEIDYRRELFADEYRAKVLIYSTGTDDEDHTQLRAILDFLVERTTRGGNKPESRTFLAPTEPVERALTVSEPTPSRPSLFISYSHADEALKDDVLKHLRVAFRASSEDLNADLWDDRRLRVGDRWLAEIEAALDRAHAAILLVSVDFLDSKFIREVEIRRLLERSAESKVLMMPLLLRDCPWERQAWLSSLQIRPTDAKPLETAAFPDSVLKDFANEVASFFDHKPTPQRHLENKDHVAPELSHSRVDAMSPPAWADPATRELSTRLETKLRERDELIDLAADTAQIDQIILGLKREIRKGPEREPGDFVADRYKLIRKVGGGGFATVWEAHDRRADQRVALKLLHGRFSTNRDRRDRFFRGARQMARLDHPHIVRVLDERGIEDGWAFFTMELLDGDFRQAVRENRLDRDQSLDVLDQVASALEFAHADQIVHRDIKPANILLSADGTAKLSDFDLVKAFDTTGATRTRQGMGSYLYSAPETMIDAANAGPACDVYGLAATALFALLGDDPGPLFMGYRDRYFETVDLPVGVREVLHRAMAHDPAERHGSPTEFCRTLRDSLMEPPPEPATQAPSEPRAQTFSMSRNPIRLDESGWAVLFGPDVTEAEKQALQPLLDLRRQQAGELYRSVDLPPDIDRATFQLSSLGAPLGFGQPAPETLPYYLMIVGNPETVPFELQYGLSVQYAVGRLHFDTADDFGRYAETVVRYDRLNSMTPRSVGIVGPIDTPERSHTSQHVLVDLLRELLGDWRRSSATFRVLNQPTKADWESLLESPPSLLFSIAPGLFVPLTDPALHKRMGALVCSDYLNQAGQRINSTSYVSGEDLDGRSLDGMISFLCSCFSAGTSQFEDSGVERGPRRRQLAPHALLSHLAKRSLANGGLAVIGHVDRTWQASLDGASGDGDQAHAIIDVCHRLLRGERIGHAMKPLHQQYVQGAVEIERLSSGTGILRPEQREHFERIQKATIDARNYILVGDPAARHK